jgi:ribosomal protein L11 methyltransferase
MPDHTIDILILTDVDPNELTGLINQPGLLGTWTENQTIHVYWDPDHWSPQAQASILTALQTLGMAHPEDLVSTHTLLTQDWNTRWGRQVKPIRIGKRVRIRPSWELASTDPQDIDLIIDPKQAFGTGHHATTQLLTEWLEDMIQGGETLLDIGTGSGILTMVGIRLGARRALGLDCDAQAIECAKEYAHTNGFREELTFTVGTLEQCSPFPWDIVVANIDRRTLLEIVGKLDQFISKTGHLFLSGLLVDDRNEIRAAFEENGWTVLQSRIQEEWLALRLTRSNQSQTAPPASVRDTQSAHDR